MKVHFIHPFMLNLIQHLLPNGRSRDKFGMTRTTRFTILGSLLILLGVGALTIYLQTNHSAEAAWYNDQWSYRKAINITVHTAAETNVYMTLSSTNALDTSDTSKFQADCGDLRFTDVSGKLLPYYIVSGCGTSSTVIHVFLQNFPAGAQIIYYYYGNPSASNGFSKTDFTTAASGVTIGSFGTEEVGPGPLAYYKFDEGTGTTAKDATSNGNNGTLSGSTLPAWRTEDQCISGKCLYFDGSSSYVTAANNATQDTASISASLWFKDTNVDSNYRVLLSKGRDAASSAFAYGLRVEDNNKLNFWYYNTGGETSLTYSTALTQGQWYHVEATYDTTTHTAILYVNGNQVATKTSGSGSLDYGTVQPLSIGDWQSGASSTDFFNGYIDDVKIYPYARTSSQVKTDYASRGSVNASANVLGASSQNNIAALNNGLVGYWKMDEATWSGTLGEVVDSSGNGNNGQAQGPTNSKAYPGSPSEFGNAGQFDGIDNYVQVPTISTLHPGDTFTLSAWVKRNVAGSFNTVVSAGSSDYQLAFVGNKIKLSKQSTGDIFVSTNTYSDTTSWHSIIAVKNGGKSTTVYYDGVAISGTYKNFTIVGAPNNIEIGDDGFLSDVFAGSIDDVRIYNRALSPADVQTLYNYAPGPIAYYNFDTGSGSTVNDTSGSGYTGTWNGTLGSQWVSGKIGKAGNFNGTNNSVQVTGLLGSPGAISLSGWVYLTSAGTSGSDVISLGDDAGIRLDGPSSGVAGFYYKGSGTWNEIDSHQTIAGKGWHHIEYTADPARSKEVLYIDGTVAVTASSPEAITYTGNGSNTFIGHHGNGSGSYNFTGKIDDIRVYNYARTSEQVISDMNAGASTVGVGANRSGPLGYWKFDEGYGTTASNQGNGGSTLNGTLTNIASPATATSGWQMNGKFNRALTFDGTNDYVDMGNQSSLNFERTNAFSMSSWIKTSVCGAVNQPIMGKINGSNAGYGMAVLNGNVYFALVNTVFTNWIDLNTNATVCDNKWHHVIATYDGSSSANGVHMYIDGNPQAVTVSGNSLSATTQTSGNFQIGGESAASVYFSGVIDDVKVYPYALSLAEVNLDYNHNSGISMGSFGTAPDGKTASNSASAIYCVPGDINTCTSPYAEFTFEEGSGSTVHDKSGNGFDGTWNGTGKNHYVPGKFGKGGNFNGTDDYVQASYNLVDAGPAYGPITVEAWIKPNSVASGTEEIISNSASGASQNYTLEIDRTAGKVSAVWGNTVIITSNASVSVGKWYHVALVRSGSSGSWTAKIYINGSLDNSGSTATDPNLIFASGATAIGSLYDGASGVLFFNGAIDQVDTFRYARTAAQIAWDYNKGAPVAWYPMDECQGTVIKDVMGNGNTGTLNLGASGVTSPGTCADGTGTTAWSKGSVGKFNSSMNFDGTDDYVDIPSSSILHSSQGSFSAWVKTTNDSDENILGVSQASIVNVFSIEIGPSNSSCTNELITVFTGNGPANVLCFNTTNRNLLFDGNWHHIVVTVGATTKIYLDGISRPITVGSGSDTAVFTQDTNFDTFRIGNIKTSGSNGNFFNGQIDDVRVYNYTLTALQVKLLYNDGASVRFGPSVGIP